MQTKILLIDEQYLRDTSTIDLNVDSKLINPSIEDAQDKYILSILGSELYNDIVNSVSSSTVSSSYRLLLDLYIKPCLAKYTMMDIVPFLCYKFTNKGVVKQNSDNNEAINSKDMDRLIERFRDSAEISAQRLTKHLISNPTTFPLYATIGNTIESIYPNSDNFTGGIYTSGNKTNYRRGYDKP